MRGHGRGMHRQDVPHVHACTHGWEDDDEHVVRDVDFQPAREVGVHLPDGFLPTCPIDFFKLFFPLAVTQNVVAFTNTYAAQRISNYFDYGDRHCAWQETNADEMYAFIALLIYMGLV